MIVTCPNCSTRYQLDAEVLVPSGRALRCVRCGHSWTQRPPADAATHVVVEEPEDDDDAEEIEVPDFGIETPRRTRRGGKTPAAARRSQRGRARRSRQAAGGGSIGWFALAGVVVAVVAALYFLRAEVVSYFPPAQQFYDVVGISTEPEAAVPGEGLKVLGDIKVAVRDEDDSRILDVEGEVQNVTRSTRAVPSVMQIILLDNDDEVVAEWKFRSPATVLGPLEKFTYSTQVIDAPLAASKVKVTFVPQDQG